MILVTEGDESFEVTMTATEMREGELETEDPSQIQVHFQFTFSFICFENMFGILACLINF